RGIEIEAEISPAQGRSQLPTHRSGDSGARVDGVDAAGVTEREEQSCRGPEIKADESFTRAHPRDGERAADGARHAGVEADQFAPGRQSIDILRPNRVRDVADQLPSADGPDQRSRAGRQVDRVKI